jgi:ABC-type antimicrobial peptide transport system permease subunit
LGVNQKLEPNKKMKTAAVGLTLSLIFTFLFCTSQKTEWQGTIEVVDGVTVVKNPKEPKYEGKPFTLEEEFSIDTERDDIATTGLTDITHFDNNVIAWPVGYYVMHRWLQDFAYRAGIAWWIFVLAAVMAFAITLLTISYQSIKAAITNPVDTLRYE